MKSEQEIKELYHRWNELFTLAQQMGENELKSPLGRYIKGRVQILEWVLDMETITYTRCAYCKEEPKECTCDDGMKEHCTTLIIKGVDEDNERESFYT